ncbi:MFS transporter [Enterococcus xiangfangensis]|uniref:MFS transporter n=1 Tax=Enterococcus xiangfangensis TaxID=1296537 RepID=UPI0010F687EB|nr:MFS transporter [Enterococcus xiangfangensis]MBM7712885.1 MFS family permease [Enterococcus xiangfangensis]
MAKTNWMIVAIYLATLVTAIESTIVVTATRSIVSSLGDPNLTSLIFSTYLFSSALATPIFGRLADNHGKKIIFQIGLLLFLLGTILCGFSVSSWMLFGARIIQGIGAGGIMPMTFALIGELFDITTRGKVMGLNNSAWGIASLIAPLIGGLILRQLTWHWIFFINVPFILLILVIVQIFYKEKAHPTVPQSGVFQQYTSLIFGLLIVLSGIQLFSTHFLLGISILIAGMLILFRFYRKEKKKDSPILPVSTILIRDFRLLTICVFLINGALIGFQVYLPMWIQTELHLSPTSAGLALLPSSVFFIIGSYYSSKLLIQFGQKRLLQLVLSGALLGFLCLSILPNTAGYSILLIFSSLLGFFIGTGVTISVISAQAYATTQNLSTVSGFITLCRTLGQSFMVTFLSVINQQIFLLKNQQLAGYHSVYLTISLIFITLLILVSYSKKSKKRVQSQ